MSVLNSCFAGHPASKVPGMLRDIVVGSMTQLEAIIEAAERADTDDFYFNPIGDALFAFGAQDTAMAAAQLSTSVWFPGWTQITT